MITNKNIFTETMIDDYMKSAIKKWKCHIRMNQIKKIFNKKDIV
jgi:hypothetical protein